MKILSVVLCLFLAACANIPSPAERRSLADALAKEQGWQAISLPAEAFELVAYLPAEPGRAATLTVYIEGDGFAWISGSQASADPTPRDPLALRLALAHPEGNSVYLARPCQYVNAEASSCASRYWTEMRFAPEVIAATNHAIDRLKQAFNASRLTLVGYSGGGTVAALAAARRTDVERLVTVAGNLDQRAWTTYHRIRPLTGSLNPADEIGALQGLRQWHFVGEKDRNITPELVRNFANGFPENLRPVVLVEPEFDHQCCWARNWPRLFQRVGG
ncbi:MAG: alpha/beta hydrolase [Rhodocyclaceae bacterium]|nr:alpha/beta hydrolase [Rhodocyclaceae bacterium]